MNDKLAEACRDYQITTIQPYPRERFPVIQVNQKDFVLVPQEVFTNLQSNRQGMLILAISGGVLLVSLAAAAVLAATKPAANAAEPIVIEKQVVVPTNCLVWCGQ